MDCVFCKIISGEIPSAKVYEDESMLAFKDLDPKAPAHILAIPKTHIASCDEIDDGNSSVVGHIFGKIPSIMKNLGVDNGYRIVANVGEDGGQTVGHLHFHCLAGRTLEWPPG